MKSKHASVSGTLDELLARTTLSPETRAEILTIVISHAAEHDVELIERLLHDFEKERAGDQKKLARLGADANAAGKKSRRDDARKVWAALNPETDRPWTSKEQCITYLMKTRGWSRSAVNSYLPTKSRKPHNVVPMRRRVRK